MGLFWDPDSPKYGWPGEDPQPVILDSGTVVKRGVRIILEKIMYVYPDGKPARSGQVIYALVLPSGTRITTTESGRWTLASLLKQEDIDYLELLVEKGLLVKRIENRDVLLPPVAHYYPDVLEDNTPAEVGCAEAPIQDISANIMSAAAAFFYLNNIIAFKRVPTQKVTYDAHNMIMVPVYIKKGKEN